MGRRFESFVILADMRTGSNALEELINDHGGLTCHGEVFNPHFIGHAGQEELFGVGLRERDSDPGGMIETLRKSTKGIAGFRLFSDHDRRALAAALKDRSCAKVVLTRNPLDSYVSLKIARKTGQWWLGDHRSAKRGKADFDAAEFEHYLAARSEWLTTIRTGLQTTGQTAFELRYEDLGNVAVIAGLVKYLGGKDSRSEPSGKHGRKQNPVPLAEKVSNFADMRLALQSRDPFDLDNLPVHEPSRGANVPSYLASRKAPLLYMPVKCADELRVRSWLAALDGASADELEAGFTRRALRQWKRRRGAHTSFTVVAHPVARAHDAFCRFILPVEDGGFTGIRRVLERSYDVPLPEDPGDETYDTWAHHKAFLAFLSFVKPNLAGQTSVRVDAAWASQEMTLRGLATFGLPDAVLRASDLKRDLPALASRLGVEAPPVPDSVDDHRYALADIYDPAIERAARAAYQRDYMMFGFGAWG